MTPQQQKLEAYLAQRAAACRQNGQLLTRDDRADEGNFEKIRANIYEIFRAVLGAAQRVHAGDEAAQHRFFLQKMGEIPAAWAAACEQARQNGDAGRMHLEQVKLDAVQEIRTACAQFWEVET